MVAWVRASALLVAGAALLVGSVAWLFAPDDFGDWALGAAAETTLYDLYLARHRAVAGCWVARFLTPLLLFLALLILARARSVAGFLSPTLRELGEATRLPAPLSTRPRRFLVRLAGAAWLALFLTHVGAAVLAAIDDWPVYGLDSGAKLVPNVSPSTRNVVHYVRQQVPEDATILLLSDQKPFFLAYYLYPRVVLHPIHPESEFVIPQAYGARQLAAYTWDDLPAERKAELDFDYVLEYFESPAYVDLRRVAEDARWLAYVRSSDAARMEGPPVLVVLRPRSAVLPAIQEHAP